MAHGQRGSYDRFETLSPDLRMEVLSSEKLPYVDFLSAFFCMTCTCGCVCYSQPCSIGLMRAVTTRGLLTTKGNEFWRRSTEFRQVDRCQVVRALLQHAF